jgi:acyl-CoA thioester hydrolase
MNKELESKFRFSTPIELRYSDMDMFGHANNAAYLTYIELARVRYMREIHDYQFGDTTFVVAHASMDFKIPILFDDDPMIYLRTSKIGNTSLTIDNVIVDEQRKKLFFEATTVMVCISKLSGEPIPVPEFYKERILGYEPSDVTVK